MWATLRLSAVLAVTDFLRSGFKVANFNGNDEFFA